MKVEIKPLDKKTWHGKKGKESFGAPIKLEVLVDARTKRYATGLSPELEKKYTEMLGLDLSSTVIPGKPHPYWSTESATIELPNHTIILDTSIPVEDIKYHNLKASKFVANTMREWEDGLFPFATHVIFSEEEEAEMYASKIEKEYSAIAKATELSLDEKIDLVLILDNKNLRGRSANMVNVELDKVIRNNPSKFLIDSTTDKKRRAVKALVLEAIHRNVLTKEGSSVYYYTERIGYDIEEAVDFLLSDDNQKVKISITEQLV